ncbi:phosphotransferase [Halioglobus sp. Uisw_031]|uniref:phosphotransferase n=1 Tax=Halioglobus sp. Uisw_031 TaxID=3230977 RepID=UPI0039E86E6E
MSNSEEDAALLDYRFAWRWLLPLCFEHKKELYGFTEKEVEFWQSAHQYDAFPSEPNGAEVSIIVDNQLPEFIQKDTLDRVESYCVMGSADVIAAWARWDSGTFTTVHEYGLLEPKNPRLAVPLGDRQWTSEALSLHRPGRIIARAAMCMLKLCSQFGFDKPLRKKVLRIAVKGADVLPSGAYSLGLDLATSAAMGDFALYFGAEGKKRKTVILPLGSAQTSILKYGESVAARKSLLNEAAALKSLSNTALVTRVPRLLELSNANGQVTLHQSYRARVWAPVRRLKTSASDLLADLSKLNRQELGLEEVLSKIEARFPQGINSQLSDDVAVVKAQLNVLAVTGRSIIGHRSHGDFAPWNISWTKQGLFVFDWEDSKEWDVALGDAFYLVVAPAVQIAGRLSIKDLEMRALSFGRKLSAAAGLGIDDIRVYWSLWLLDRMGMQPHAVYSQLIARLASTWK